MENKTPSYLLKAQKDYYNRNKNNPEFMEKKRKYSTLYQMKKKIIKNEKKNKNILEHLCVQ